MTILANQNQLAFIGYGDDGDTRLVIDPALAAAPAVGEKNLSLKNIEYPAAVN
jgi:hypothetical protein